MYMTFRQFKKWVYIHTICGDFNDDTISYLNDVIDYIKAKQFWNRTKTLKNEFEMQLVNGNYIPILKDFIELKNEVCK